MIIKMQRPAFGFIVSESTMWRSRDEVEVSTDVSILPATLLQAGLTAADPAVVWDGTAAVIGILCQGVVVDEDGPAVTVRRTILAREAEVFGGDLVLPEASDFNDVIAALKPLGIVVRLNQGRHIDVVAPSAT